MPPLERLGADALASELARIPSFTAASKFTLDAVRIAIARAIASGQSADQLAIDFGLPSAWRGVDLNKPPAIAGRTAQVDAQAAAAPQPAAARATAPGWVKEIVPIALAKKATARVVVLDREPTALGGLELPAWARALKPAATYGPITVTSPTLEATTQKWILIFWFTGTVEIVRAGSSERTRKTESHMSGTNRNLTLMILPQSWDGHQLVANLLLLPNGDPTAPVPLISGSELPFSKAQPVVRAALLPGTAVVPPWDPSITPAMLTHIPLALTYSSAEQPIFSAIATEFTPALPPLTQPNKAIFKDLPQSYLEATGFQTPGTGPLTTGHDFICSLGGDASKPNTTPVSPRSIAWGEVLSYALRQPLIAQAMGLIYTQVAIPLSTSQLTSGGWIWIEIDTSNNSNWYAKLLAQNAQAVSTNAARLPVLCSAAQDVFAAVLFPTVAGNYISQYLDDAQGEADVYFDGFAKIVHANQPTSSDAVANDTTHIVPGTDAGIQIGWDDERVTNSINRQVSIAQQLAASTPPTPPLVPELPFTILGYRVDAREKSTDPWSSLCAASATLNAANVFTTSFSGQDLCVEPNPVQNGSGDYWLPQYFAQWRGRMLVVNDLYAYAFSGGQPRASTPPSDSDFTGTITESLPGISLRFGQNYEFRARLADLTGGGPLASDESPTDADSASITFKRWVPPKKFGSPSQPTTKTAARRSPSNVQLRRADGEAYRNLLLGKLKGIEPPPTATGFEPKRQQQSIPVTAAFPLKAVDEILTALKLPTNMPLSVIAVELFNAESLVIRDNQINAEIPHLPSRAALRPTRPTASGAGAREKESPTLSAAAQATAKAQVSSDPLGQDLGAQRILRVSPLVPVRAVLLTGKKPALRQKRLLS